MIGKVSNMKICIASGNPHKIKELTSILQMFADVQLEISSIHNMNIPEPAEPYPTFMENACYKAKYYADFTKVPTLSEDSGLCIEALDDFPGVYTKDFALECGSLSNAFFVLETKLQDKTNYNACFVCAAVLYLPVEQIFIKYEGRHQGRISFPPRGGNCFGFDPIFTPGGYTQTMAELGEDLKNTIGHRAIAIRGIMEQLRVFNKEYNASTHN